MFKAAAKTGRSSPCPVVRSAPAPPPLQLSIAAVEVPSDVCGLEIQLHIPQERLA